MSAEPLHAATEETAGAAQAATAPTVLRLAGVTKRWRDAVVLDDVDLELHAGEFAWLGGENGTGKTTLLRIAAGLIRPQSGEVTLQGLTVERNRVAYYRRIGFLSAGDRGLYARLTARQNLDFAGGMALIPRQQRREAVNAAIERFALEPLARRRVDRMSMGQRQRVRLAMTFLHDPVVILLDEPRTSLDDTGLELLGRAIDDVKGRGGCALWCSPRGDPPRLDVDVRYALEAAKVVPC